MLVTQQVPFWQFFHNTLDVAVSCAVIAVIEQIIAIISVKITF